MDLSKILNSLLISEVNKLIWLNMSYLIHAVFINQVVFFHFFFPIVAKVMNVNSFNSTKRLLTLKDVWIQSNTYMVYELTQHG